MFSFRHLQVCATDDPLAFEGRKKRTFFQERQKLDHSTSDS